jgi:hypothetical protein
VTILPGQTLLSDSSSFTALGERVFLGGIPTQAVGSDILSSVNRPEYISIRLERQCPSHQSSVLELGTTEILEWLMVSLQDKFRSVQVLLVLQDSPYDGETFTFDGGVPGFTRLKLAAGERHRMFFASFIFL